MAFTMLPYLIHQPMEPHPSANKVFPLFKHYIFLCKWPHLWDLAWFRHDMTILEVGVKSYPAANGNTTSWIVDGVPHIFCLTFKALGLKECYLIQAQTQTKGRFAAFTFIQIIWSDLVYFHTINHLMFVSCCPAIMREDSFQSEELHEMPSFLLLGATYRHQRKTGEGTVLSSCTGKNNHL